MAIPEYPTNLEQHKLLVVMSDGTIGQWLGQSKTPQGIQLHLRKVRFSRPIFGGEVMHTDPSIQVDSLVPLQTSQGISKIILCVQDMFGRFSLRHYVARQILTFVTEKQKSDLFESAARQGIAMKKKLSHEPFELQSMVGTHINDLLKKIGKEGLHFPDIVSPEAQSEEENAGEQY